MNEEPHILDRDPSMGFAIKLIARPVLNVDQVVTQILENGLLELDVLRRDIEKRAMKAIDDVRDMGFPAILAGIEEDITYDGLCDIIKELKDGIAMRRVQLMQEAEA